MCIYVKMEHSQKHKLWESGIVFYILWVCVCFFSHPKLHVTWFERFSIIDESEKEPVPTIMIVSTSFLLLSPLNDGNTSHVCPFDCNHSGRSSFGQKEGGELYKVQTLPKTYVFVTSGIGEDACTTKSQFFWHKSQILCICDLWFVYSCNFGNAPMCNFCPLKFDNWYMRCIVFNVSLKGGGFQRI